MPAMQNPLSILVTARRTSVSTTAPSFPMMTGATCVSAQALRAPYRPGAPMGVPLLQMNHMKGEFASH